ncbi:MAG: thioesterase family protein [Achromobacter pulmonis]
MERPMLEARALFQTGQHFEKTCVVDAAASSLNYGGDLDVLATPVIVYWIESYATECIRLAGGGRCGSVGHAVSVRHVAPALRGSAVHLTITVETLFGNSLRFSARAVTGEGGTLIATGTHDRTLVEL